MKEINSKKIMRIGSIKFFIIENIYVNFIGFLTLSKHVNVYVTLVHMYNQKERGHIQITKKGY